MSISASAQGRRYGPFTYQVGIEKVREFALAVGGGIPSSGFSFESAPADIQPPPSAADRLPGITL